MEKDSQVVRAWFLSLEKTLYPDYQICSGILPSELGGKPCPFSNHGRLPYLQRIDERIAKRKPPVGKEGDLAPLCAIQQLGSVGLWRGAGGIYVPPGLSELRLFLCRQWYLLIIPGLRDDQPGEILPSGRNFSLDSIE